MYADLQRPALALVHGERLRPSGAQVLEDHANFRAGVIGMAGPASMGLGTLAGHRPVAASFNRARAVGLL